MRDDVIDDAQGRGDPLEFDAVFPFADDVEVGVELLGQRGEGFEQQVDHFKVDESAEEAESWGGRRVARGRGVPRAEVDGIGDEADDFAFDTRRQGVRRPLVGDQNHLRVQLPGDQLVCQPAQAAAEPDAGADQRAFHVAERGRIIDVAVERPHHDRHGQSVDRGRLLGADRDRLVHHVDHVARQQQLHDVPLPALSDQLADRPGGADAELLGQRLADLPEQLVLPGVGGEGDAVDVGAEQFGQFFLAAFVDAQPRLDAAFAEGAEIVDRASTFAAHLETGVVTDDHHAGKAGAVGRHHVFPLSAIGRWNVTGAAGQRLAGQRLRSETWRT